MIHSDDTVVALSSAAPLPARAAVSILRISGPETFAVGRQLAGDRQIPRQRSITHLVLEIEGVSIPATLYAFCGPHSYTGQDMIELHLTAAGPVVDCLFASLLGCARQAGPGEFTYRAYLNGRMDLTQAEAVAQIVSGSNAAQLTAAEKLLAGNLSAVVAAVRENILELLSRIEAGLDFTEEDIEFISAEQAVDVLAALISRLDHLLSSTIQYERMIDLPSVGIAGATNAGKSSLINALLGRDRSVVSDRRATTRDVLSEILPLEDLDCVLFDCAGLADAGPDDPLDALAQQAAYAALQQADLILLCVDINKQAFVKDHAISRLLTSQFFLAVAGQCDRIDACGLPARLAVLQEEFGMPFLPTSARTGAGLPELKTHLRNTLISLRGPGSEANQRIAINQRHRQILSDASSALREAKEQISRRNDEIAAMLLRGAWQQLGGIQREDIEEAVLDRIFSQFCVGK